MGSQHCSRCKIVVYIGPPGASGLQSALQKAVSDNTCGTIDISYTLCGLSSFFTNTLDPIFVQAARQGQAVFSGTGDNGAAEGTINSGGACPQTAAGVKELAADPYVTAVGGTQFTPNYDSSGNDVGFVSETVWQDANGASGGGVSAVFGEPSYQIQQSLPANSMRSIPDVTIGASPTMPGFWFVDGTSTLVQAGGTSLAAPVWAGIGALLANNTGHRVGNLNARLYQMGPLAASVGLRDVTSGDNTFGGVNGVSAGPGYDEASGWGTPDVSTLAGQFLGKVLISGGESGTTVLSSAERYNLVNKTFTATTGGMTTKRMCHTSTLLNTGKTLIAGGLGNPTGGEHASAELYTPSTDTFVATGSMSVPRSDHAAVMLKDG